MESEANTVEEFDLKSKFETFLKTLAGTFFCAIFLILILCNTPVYIFRLVAILLAKWFRPDLGEVLNALSSILVNDLFSGKRPRSSIIVPMTLQGHWTQEEFKEIVQERWIKAKDKKTGEPTYQKFCQYPYHWLGFTFWKNDERFNLENHIHYHESPLETPVSSEKLNELVENLLNERFKLESSPWDLHYVANYRNTQDDTEGYNSDEPTFALVLKIHHCLADGFSILSALVEGLGGQSLDDMKLPSPQPPKQTLMEQIISILSFPLTAFSELLLVASQSYNRCPWRVSDKRKAWWQLYGKSQLIPIQQVKDIKNGFGVSFTSVLLSTISSGIHKDLELRQKSTTFPDTGYMPCLSVLPVPGHSRRLTNRATGAIVSLPTSYLDPGCRLRACDLLLRNGRNSVVPNLARLCQAVLGCHFYSVCSVFSKNTIVSAGLTNFPGIPIKIKIGRNAGISVDFAAGALEGNAGVAFMVLSFGEHIRIALTAEKAVMTRKQVDDLIYYIHEEIKVLYDEAKTLTNDSKKLR